MAKRPDLSHINASLHGLAVPISDVLADPANSRRHSQRSTESLGASLRRFGQQVPILVDASGIVVKGNGTLEAAKALGWRHIAAIRTELQGADRTAYAIADNRVGELSDFDIESLARQLTDLEDYVGDSSLGFTREEIDALADSMVVRDLKPVSPVTAEEVQKTADRMDEGQGTNRKVAMDVICPDCGHEFKVSEWNQMEK